MMLAARKPLCVFKTSFLKIIPRNIKPYLFAKALRSGPPRFFRRCFLEPCSAAAGHLGLDKESHAVEIEDVRHVTMDCWSACQPSLISPYNVSKTEQRATFCTEHNT
jgi:hypothetical protein